MSEKSHVALVQEYCPICGLETDSYILLDQSLKNSLDPHYDQFGSYCSRCKEGIEQGGIGLIGVDPSKCSGPKDASILKQGQAYRTGEGVFITSEAFQRIFNIPLPNPPFAFVEQEVLDMFKEQLNRTE